MLYSFSFPENCPKAVCFFPSGHSFDERQNYPIPSNQNPHFPDSTNARIPTNNTVIFPTEEKIKRPQARECDVSAAPKKDSTFLFCETVHLLRGERRGEERRGRGARIVTWAEAFDRSRRRAIIIFFPRDGGGDGRRPHELLEPGKEEREKRGGLVVVGRPGERGGGRSSRTKTCPILSTEPLPLLHSCWPKTGAKLFFKVKVSKSTQYSILSLP